MRLIDITVAAKGPVTAQTLASKSEADIFLVVRVMRILSASSLFHEVGVETYIAGARAAAYVLGSPLREAVVYL
jgi:hypothetical protein